MKKYAALLLAMTLLLTGCGAQGTAQTQTTAPSQTEESTSPTVESTAVPEEIIAEESIPETTAPETEVTQSPEDSEKETVSTPAQDTVQQSTSSQSTTQSKPQQTTTQSNSAQTSKPSTSSRPTSSATCKDTGSSKVWVDPAVSQWEVNDPQRTAYIQTNTNVTTLYDNYGSHSILGGQGGLNMYIGHTYGMPFLHDGDASDLKWVSSDPTVATVNEVGFVTPLREGEIEIGFYDQNGQYYRRMVRVYTEIIHTEAELEQMAKEEAKAIADYIMNELSLNSDLKRIGAAARIVYEYMSAGNTIPSYTINPDGSASCNVVGYNRPFGTLITGYSTCAGDVRALGLILEYMGFEWYHVNENQWDHQWCVVYDVDGQTAFADGSWNGIVGYGERQEDGSNWMRYENGTLVAA